MCQYLLGRYASAIDTLKQSDGGALSHFYLGKSYLALERVPRSGRVRYEASAATAGYDRDDVALAKAEALRYARRPGRSRCELLDALSGAVEQTAEYLYQRSATVQALGGNPRGGRGLAGTSRRRSIREHAGALFGLALENDRRGNDDYALRLVRTGSRGSSPRTWGRC